MSPTLNDLIDQYIEEVCAGKTNETPQAYRTKLKYLSSYLGVSEIDQQSVNRWRMWLLNHKQHHRGARLVNGPLSLFTCRTVIQTVRQFLKWAYAKGYLPQIQLQQIREPVPEPKAIDEATVSRLLKAAVDYGETWQVCRNTALIYVLRDTGCRVGAVANMDMSNLDLSRGLATSITKGAQLCTLYFEPPTIRALREWLSYRETLKPVDQLVWTGSKGIGMTRLGIYRMLKSLARQAGIVARCNPHAFRHAFARDVILAGADLSQASEMLGHKSTVITSKYYARWSRKEVQSFHRKFSPGRLLE
jgi:site-specific recombinase XerD